MCRNYEEMVYLRVDYKNADGRRGLEWENRWSEVNACRERLCGLRRSDKKAELKMSLPKEGVRAPCRHAQTVLPFDVQLSPPFVWNWAENLFSDRE